MTSRTRRLLAFSLSAGLGVAVLVVLHLAQPEPRKSGGRAQRGTAVRVITATPITVTPTARGFGVVRAKRTWQGAAQVGGTIVQMAEGLEVGRTVRKGTVLFKIDPGAYELERSRSEASVQGVNASVKELDAKVDGAKSALRVQNQLLDLARKDLARAKTLRVDGVLSQSDLEATQRAVLTAEMSVRATKNTLAQLPQSRKVLEAQLAQMRAGVQGAEIDVGRTVIVAPFTMQIAEVHASLHQNINAGGLVVVGYERERMEVPAQMPVGTMGPLLGRRTDANAEQGPVPSIGEETQAEKAADSGAEDSDGGEADDLDPAARAARREARLARISATVKLNNLGVESEWPAAFRRFEGIDPATRTMIVVVEVERQPRSGQAGQRTAWLRPGMHVEVALAGAAKTDCIAIPRTALHRDTVYVVDADERLAMRVVEVDLVQEDYFCVSKGLAPGEQVVLDDLTPAVAGMLLSPQVDGVAAKRVQGDQAPAVVEKPKGNKRGEGKAGAGKAGEGKAGEGTAGEGKAGEGKAGEGRAGRARGEGKGGKARGEKSP